MKTALVLGGGGFIGSHMVTRLKSEGFWVRAVDLKKPEFSETTADEFIVGDLRDPALVEKVIDRQFDEVYQFAADMGGAGFVFTGDNDADIMHNSSLINLNVLYYCAKQLPGRLFYSSSACVYPENPSDPRCPESLAYPAFPDSEYGWEKLFSERMYSAFERNYQVPVRIARYHNIFGPEGTWTGGREKAPAAICRKVAEAHDGSNVEIWGTGTQLRSFLYIDECIEGTLQLTRSDYSRPLNIGSDEAVSINQLVDIVSGIAGKKLTKTYAVGPVGVNGRNSENSLVQQVLGWRPTAPLADGLAKTYAWINSQVNK